MSFLQDKVLEVVQKPAPEFNDIGYAGDGALFPIKGNDGFIGKIPVAGQGPNIPPYDTSLDYSETCYFDSNVTHNYKKFNLDFLIKTKVRLQSTDLKVSGAGLMDFIVFEVLYLANPENDIWVLGKRFVKKFYFNTDFEDQDTPTLPYSKTLEAGYFAIRMVYHKHESNTSDVFVRANYMLHEVVE
jgi:hypothetical protein